MRKIKCMEPGCTQQAELHLKGLAYREWLCREHAQAAVNRAQPIAIAVEELDEHRNSGGQLN
jgi:hypothetical protein